MTTRLTWHDLPRAVRDRVGEALGEPVVASRSCNGGFSPSTAEVVRGASGRSVFVKAVRERDNPDSVVLNRQEAAALAGVPAALPIPALRTVFELDDGGSAVGRWLVLVMEAADGAVVEEPWTPGRLDAVLAALDELQAQATPCPVPGLPRLSETLGDDLLGFDRVLVDPPADLDPWIDTRLLHLAAAARRGIAALGGDTLCHADLRADNIVIADDGATVRFVDWAYASRGSRIADAVQLIGSVDDPDGTLALSERMDVLLDRHDVERAVGTQMLTGMLGFFVDAARFPDGAVLTGLQAARRRRRDVLLCLVRDRWDDGNPQLTA